MSEHMLRQRLLREQGKINLHFPQTETGDCKGGKEI